MKKMLSLACAFLMGLSCTAVSANAENKDFVALNDGLTLVVTNVENDDYLMLAYSSVYYENGVNDGFFGDIRYYSPSEKFEVGDILIPVGNYDVVETRVGKIVFSPKEDDEEVEGGFYQKIGTCAELGLEVPESDEEAVDFWRTYYLHSEKTAVPLDDKTVLAKGDASGSGSVDIIDVIIANRAIQGIDTLTDEQLEAIDLNKNGKPDSDDAVTLLKYIVGLIDSLD